VDSDIPQATSTRKPGELLRQKERVAGSSSINNKTPCWYSGKPDRLCEVCSVVERCSFYELELSPSPSIPLFCSPSLSCCLAREIVVLPRGFWQRLEKLNIAKDNFFFFPFSLRQKMLAFWKFDFALIQILFES